MLARLGNNGGRLWEKENDSQVSGRYGIAAFDLEELSLMSEENMQRRRIKDVQGS